LFVGASFVDVVAVVTVAGSRFTAVRGTPAGSARGHLLKDDDGPVIVARGFCCCSSLASFCIGLLVPKKVVVTVCCSVK